MLLPGIKLGPRDWSEKLNASNASIAEIWYRVDQPGNYTAMIDELNHRGIRFGLHFWGVTSSGHEANLAYPGKNQTESIALIRQCIDDAGKAGATYVNIHSGNYSLMLIDFAKETLLPDDTYPLINPQTAANTRNQALQGLGAYAQANQVNLLVEAIPAKVANGKWLDAKARLNPVPEYPAPLTGLDALCEQGCIGFTNDFCHTFSIEFDQPRAYLYARFSEITRALAPYTQVVHVNTLTAPYNGSDAHGGILPDELNYHTVFPNQQEFRHLLQLLTTATGSDVWLIGEPKQHHVENYVALKNLLQTL